MQLVLMGKRVVAHGENFLATGGTVINTVTGVKYENATVAECEGCPSDIDSVGYEYHAGQFIPCAPYGKGNNNGYFMEVCTDCATPRNSGIPIKKGIRLINLNDEVTAYALGGTAIQTLWENASQSSSFANQTITLANSDWDILIVEICNNGGSVIISENSNNTDVHYYYDNGGQYILLKRNISVTSKTTLSITNIQNVSVQGYYWNVGDNSAYNNLLIPYRIYGVKMGVAK